MSRILCLAHSGFGKTTGIGNINEPDLGIVLQGLNPQTSYILSVTTKPLPWRGSAKVWPVAPNDRLSQGKRVITDDADKIIAALNTLYTIPQIKTVVLDDLNYIMQDWYMDNALRTGWEAPKKIGFFMGQIFKSIEQYKVPDKHIIVLAHGEKDDAKSKEGRIYTKFKTTGKMVDEYITPEGKFDITLVGRSRFDTNTKRAIKEYVTNEDAEYMSPKSGIGMLPPYISNDLGKLIELVDKYYLGE